MNNSITESDVEELALHILTEQDYEIVHASDVARNGKEVIY